MFGLTSFTYDKNGNLTSDGTNTYIFDAMNRLTEMETGSLIKTQTYAFAYEPFGRRASKTVGSKLSNTVTTYVYDGYNKIQEVVGGTLTASYLNSSGIDSALSRTAGGSTYSYLADADGSKVALTGSTGAIQTNYQYEPYGETAASGVTSTNDLQFAGRENDGSGLLYYRARYYSQNFKRFISEDPIEYSGGPNIYSYVGGNPISYVDPLGLKNYSECETQGYLDQERNDMQGWNKLGNAIGNHGNPGYFDFKLNQPNDTFTTGGQTYNAGQFGNYLAGYGGGYFGVGGYLGVRAGGLLFNLLDISNFNFDQDSVPYIDAGYNRAMNEINGAGPIVPCGCNK